VFSKKVTVFNLRKKSILGLIIIHFGFGFLVSLFPVVTLYWQLLVIAYGCIHIIRQHNKHEEAAFWASYLAGMEVFYRMTGQSVFWELGKYGVVLFLVLGLLMGGRQVRYTYGLYFLLLIPSIGIGAYTDFAQARDMISFNLSGPLCLAVSGLYFYKQQYSGPMLLALMRALILPVLSMVAYLFLQTPKFSSISFGTESNFSTSGGYGPNQVSLVLGFCIFLIIILRYYSISFSGFRWLDYGLIGILLFRALITFSRGGVFGAAVALGIFLILNATSGYGGKRIGNAILISLFLVSGGVLVWNYTNSLTDEALAYRYAGINKQTGREEEYTTGRVVIFQRDITIFERNPILGIGPGKAKLETGETRGKEIAAHTEWSRMLAEHGVFGLMALLILIFVPLVHVLKVPPSSRPLLLAITILSMFSMFHAAMRLALISYLYAWALIIPMNEKNPIRRK